MTCRYTSRCAFMGCAAVAMLATANAVGWIAVPWAWFFLPVWLPFLAGAALLGLVVVAAWTWLVLAAAWAVLRPVGHGVGRLLAFPACGRALRCARLQGYRSEDS